MLSFARKYGSMKGVKGTSFIIHKDLPPCKLAKASYDRRGLEGVADVLRGEVSGNVTFTHPSDDGKCDCRIPFDSNENVYSSDELEQTGEAADMLMDQEAAAELVASAKTNE